MPETIVIADTSCLIGLNNIGRLNLLQSIFENIIITPEVKYEFGEHVPEWMQVESVADTQKTIILELELDKGEASAIALAMEKKDALLIIDEKKGRRVAISLGVNTLGTLGILLKAKDVGLLPSIKTEIETLESKGFRISETLKINILSKAKE